MSDMGRAVDSGRGQGKEPAAQAAFDFARDPEVTTRPSRHRAAPPPARWTGRDQLSFTLGPEYDEVTPPIPATYGECKAPAHQALMAACGGTCPVLRCRHHIALWVRDHKGDASDADRLESVKIEGGVGRGRTARGTRSLTGQAKLELAERVEDLADRMARLAAKGLPGIESLCSLDYADRWRMTPAGIRSVLGLRPRRMSKMLTDAADELDIARARLRRQEAAAKAVAFEQAKLVQIRPHPSKGAERVRRVERHRAAAAAKAEK